MARQDVKHSDGLALIYTFICNKCVAILWQSGKLLVLDVTVDSNLAQSVADRAENGVKVKVKVYFYSALS